MPLTSMKINAIQLGNCLWKNKNKQGSSAKQHQQKCFIEIWNAKLPYLADIYVLNWKANNWKISYD